MQPTTPKSSPAVSSGLTITSSCGVPVLSPGKRLKTLLVSKDESLLRTVKSTFDFCDRVEVVATARDGEEAVELALSLRPAMIVMEVLLPRMDGVEAATRIKEEFPGARIILMTADNNTHIQQPPCYGGEPCVVIPKNKLPQQVCKILREQFGPCISPGM